MLQAIKQTIKSINRREWIIGGIALLLFVIIILFIFKKVNVPGADPLYEHLKAQNDSLMKEQVNVSRREMARKKEVDSLKSLIDTISSKIIKIRIDVEKRIPVYDNYTPEQLERYFSDRYPGARH